jgi:hypothetical protein
MDQPRYRTLIEKDEYSKQLDGLLDRYSAQQDLLEYIINGLLWGIATNPQAYDRTTWRVRWAPSNSFGAKLPAFVIVFQIQNEGLEDEHVLLLWIDELSAIRDVLAAD